jgi:N-glycosylase/DNA lyase
MKSIFQKNTKKNANTYFTYSTFNRKNITKKKSRIKRVEGTYSWEPMMDKKKSRKQANT